MKASRWFILFILALLLLMFAIEYHLPKKYVWEPTFSHYDEQPLGCAVFDSLLTVSLPSGYSLSRKTFYQLEQEDTVTRKGILVVAKNIPLEKVEVNSLLKMAERGNKIMLVSSSFSKSVEDTLNFSSTYSYFNPVQLKNYAASFLKRDTIYWVGSPEVYSRQYFCFYPQFCKSYFHLKDSLPVRRLAEIDMTTDMGHALDDLDSVVVLRNYHPLVAMARAWGQGEIILVSTPLLFTNYGVLDGENATYIFRLLSQMGTLPIVRMESYNPEVDLSKESPFRYFLSQKPLRWAIYLSMFGVLLFMIFTARRRQRAIPVMHEPENKSLEFTKLIGTLYHQKHNHADLVHKKFLYFAEILRREIQVDVEEVAEDERSVMRIASKTGMDVEDIRKFIRELRPVLYGGRVLSGEEMKVFIDKMNEIINHI